LLRPPASIITSRSRLSHGFVFVAAQLALGYLVWKYREGGSSEKASYSHGNTTLEVVWTVLTTILFCRIESGEQLDLGSRTIRAAEANAVHVEVTGMQFAWYFRYPGPDGKFGLTKPETRRCIRRWRSGFRVGYA